MCFISCDSADRFFLCSGAKKGNVSGRLDMKLVGQRKTMLMNILLLSVLKHRPSLGYTHFRFYTDTDSVMCYIYKCSYNNKCVITESSQVSLFAYVIYITAALPQWCGQVKKKIKNQVSAFSNVLQSCRGLSNRNSVYSLFKPENTQEVY